MNNKMTFSKLYCAALETMSFFRVNKTFSRYAPPPMLPVGILAVLLGTGTVITLPTSVNANTTQPAAQVPEGRAILYVNPVQGNDSSGAGTQETAPYRTISYALSQAKAGTIIQLAPGTYSSESGEKFPLSMKAGVTLQGNESTKGQTVIINGGGSYLSPTFAGQNVTFVTQQDSQIRGITVTNPNSRGTGVWIETGNPVIQNSTFVNSLREGIFVTGDATPKITSNVFTQNKANGLSVAKAAQGEIRGNVFDNTGFGIAISETAAPLVIDNQVVGNQDGIVISHSARPVLRQNRIESNTRNGVVLITDAQPDFGTSSSPGSNILRSNGQYDLYNLSSHQTLVTTGNEIGSSQQGKVELQAEPPTAEIPQEETNTTADAK